VFYRILKNPHFQHIQEPKAWLLGIAKHVMVDYWRKQHIEKLYLKSLSALAEPLHPPLEHQIIIQESLYQLHRLLEQMPQRRAAIFLLSQLEGLNYAMIAERLEISESTVKREIKYAFLHCMQRYHDVEDLN
jgi:RNA polymerase sigma factor (sigma-70 family)